MKKRSFKRRIKDWYLEGGGSDWVSWIGGAIFYIIAFAVVIFLLLSPWMIEHLVENWIA